MTLRKAGIFFNLCTLTVSVLTISVLTCLQSCNLKLPGTNTNTETYSYQFNVNGCDTGKRVFNDRISMCNALKDHAGNYFCAYNERQAKFLNECYDQGSFVQSEKTWPELSK